MRVRDIRKLSSCLSALINMRTDDTNQPLMRVLDGQDLLLLAGHLRGLSLSLACCRIHSSTRENHPHPHEGSRHPTARSSSQLLIHMSVDDIRTLSNCLSTLIHMRADSTNQLWAAKSSPTGQAKSVDWTAKSLSTGRTKHVDWTAKTCRLGGQNMSTSN